VVALYESLCSTAFHKSEDYLANNFNYVFEECQRKNVLRLLDVLPATARFLFQKHAIRSRFAKASWQSLTKALDADNFDWVVHDALGEAIVKVAQPNADSAAVQNFWSGFLLILDKMDGPLITHSLRAMEVQPGIYHLGLQHLQLDSAEIVQDVIQAFSQLLKKSPKDFWSALGTISPATVAEQIFNSPGFRKLLENEAKHIDYDTNPAVTWIPSFIQSLEPIHRYDACRSLLFNLLERFQGTDASSVGAKLLCCRAGLESIRVTLHTFTSPDYTINPSTSLLVINDIMGLVHKYQKLITGTADLGPDSDNMALKHLGMTVIGEALALDCKAMSAEFMALSSNIAIQRGLRSHSQSVWQAVLDIFRKGNVELAKVILSATTTLTGLDVMLPKNKKAADLMPKDHVEYNRDFGQLMDSISRVYERLSDFESEELQELCRSPQTARPVFAALLSSSQDVFEAAVALIKALTSKMGKQDAVEALLDDFFVPTLNSLTFAVGKICKSRTFSPVPYTIKTGREILTALSGSTGKLRSGSLSTAERGAVLAWWKGQWRVMDMVFCATESWAPRVDKSTAYMQDFCRDAMEYSESLFNNYTVFASALTDPMLGDSKASTERVLEVVCQNVNGLTGLLRLRDSYLVSVITSLLGKLLRCLGESNLEIDDYASEFIKAACKRENQRDFKRTNLTPQQKAELQRALDEHQGVEIVEPTPVAPVVKKQGTIDAWSKSADGKRHEPTLPVRQTTLTLASQTEKNRALLNSMRPHSVTQPAAASRDMTDFKEKRRQAEAEKQRIKNEQAAKARALRGSSGVRGEGSGLKDIGGVFGKDHAPIRNEIMVGSSDEDSDADADEDETNALVKTRKVGAKAVSEYEASRRRALKELQQGPVRKVKVQRSVKDLRARVEPNMDRLYTEILEWELFHEGDTPPTSNEYRRIADNFIDLDIYKKTFTPLLIAEVWRSLVVAKEENNSRPIEITVLNRMSVDKFMEISAKMPMTLNRDMKLNERDIVLLSKCKDPMNHREEPHCLARVDRTTRKKDIIEVTLKVSRNIDQELLKGLSMNAKIHTVKLADMNTTQREYAALSSLEYYDLCAEVMEAKPSPLQKYSDEKINNLKAKYNLNKGQSQAILSANDNDGFTLIQGPPGSGKTKTIIAMVGALLTQALQQQNAQPRALAPMPGRADKSTPSIGPKKKLLICAPSNAAVDELVVRLKEGIQPLSGPHQKINVIRIGRSDVANAGVQDVMLDELVRRKMEGDDSGNKVQQDRDKLHKEAGAIKEQLNALRPQMDALRQKSDPEGERKLQKQFDELKRKQAHLGNKIDEEKQSGNTFARQNEINRRKYQQEIIDGAHVLCSTLSGSGHDMFKHLSIEFETVIIDEAAQCIELSALIPLKYGCSKCILVGDPEQLPPTVLSRSAQSYGYEQSLFVRMQKNHPKDVHLLDTQYRMHPDISSFPSQQFYKGRLLDGDGMAKLRRQAWHASTILGPYRFFDVEGVQTQGPGHSFINVPELNAAMQLYQRLKTDYQSIDFTGKIGIITTYKAQLNALKDRFQSRFGESIFNEIEFNTTDAFQGREREIIIFSCVRAKSTGGIGFLSDIRRMNVGLTRAKSSLWVLGDSRSLRQGEFWNKLIEDAKARKKYSGGDVMGLLSKTSSRNEVPPPSPLANGRPALPSNSSFAATSNLERRSSVAEATDNDVIMTDAPMVSTVRQGSMSEENKKPARPTPTRGLSSDTSRSKPDSRNSSPGIGGGASAKNPHGKRARDSISEDGIAHKKVRVPVQTVSTLTNFIFKAAPAKDKGPDLDAALRAQQANKPTPTAAKPARPPGMMPPRRKAAADPFIQRKPPKRG
jgi:senataxin